MFVSGGAARPNHAVLLAAGRGRRLGTDEPKSLIEVGGRTLLERHFENLHRAGVGVVTIVTGYQEARIKAFVAEKGSPIEVRFITNPAFERGSIVSLQTAGHLVAAGCIWMDADVLYPAALMKRLIESKHDNCVLLDGRSEETGEEMMLGVRDERIRTIARKISHLGPWELMGEAVGFAKVGPEGGRAMKRILDGEVAAARLDQEYEAAMNTAFGQITWGYERVDEFAWTEIDFQADIEKAQRLAKEIDEV